jgi:hypothetical protein
VEGFVERDSLLKAGRQHDEGYVEREEHALAVQTHMKFAEQEHRTWAFGIAEGRSTSVVSMKLEICFLLSEERYWSFRHGSDPPEQECHARLVY